MSYDALYQYCQTLDPVIGRNVIRDKVRELKQIVGLIRVMGVELDVNVTWGFLLKPTNSNHPIVQTAGTQFICVARELIQNRCKCRMVVVKELMHFFDADDEITDTAAKFGTLLKELASQTAGKVSPAFMAEHMATWMALGVMCPEKHRVKMKQEYLAGKKTAYDVALYFRIPQYLVPILFDELFLPVIYSARGVAQPVEKE